jgi:hypothetical protein
MGFNSAFKELYFLDRCLKITIIKLQENPSLAKEVIECRRTDREMDK